MDGQKYQSNSSGYQRVVSEEEIDELENTAESNLCIQSDSIEEVDRIDLEGTSSRVEPTPDEPPKLQVLNTMPQLRTPKSETILKSPSQIISQGSCNGSPLFITGIDIDIDEIILTNYLSNCSTISAISSNVITGHISNDQIVVDSQPISMQLDYVSSSSSPAHSSKILVDPHADSPLKNQIETQHLNESKMELSKTLLEKPVHINESLESLNLLEPGQKRKYKPESSEKSGDSKRRAHVSLQNTRGSAQILEEIRSKIEAITKKHQTELSADIFDCVSSMFLDTIVPSLSYDHNHRWDGMPSSPDSFSDRLDFQLPTSFF